jgi:RNA polymerase sigma-70 factor (ECF subfamily)
MSTDRTAMGARNREESRLNRLVVENSSAIDAFCLRRLPHDDAVDASAEVFLIAWRRIHVVPEGSDALLWLYGVARNVVANHKRANRRRLRLIARVGSQRAPHRQSADEAVVHDEKSRMVIGALETLGASDQELLRLRTWEELSSAELASLLQTTTGAIDMRLSRAKKRLARALVKAGYHAEDQTRLRTAEEGGSS